MAYILEGREEYLDRGWGVVGEANNDPETEQLFEIFPIEDKVLARGLAQFLHELRFNDSSWYAVPLKRVEDYREDQAHYIESSDIIDRDMSYRS